MTAIEVAEKLLTSLAGPGKPTKLPSVLRSHEREQRCEVHRSLRGRTLSPGASLAGCRQYFKLPRPTEELFEIGRQGAAVFPAFTRQVGKSQSLGVKEDARGG